MGAEEMLREVGLLGLPFLGWLVVVVPLMLSATLRADGEGRESGCQDRRLLLKFCAGDGLDALASLPAAQPDGGRHQGVPAVQRLPPRRGDQRPLVSIRVTTNDRIR